MSSDSTLAYRIEILDGSCADAISKLRIKAYEKFANDQLQISALRWGPTDSWSLNLGVLENNDLLSVLRIEKHKTAASLELALQSPMQPNRFPTAVLSRAATDDRGRRQDLHMLLRLFALKGMLQAEYKEVFGTFKSRSQRSAFLEELGYKMTRQGAAWSDFLRTDEPTDLAVLDLEAEGDNAVRKLEEAIRSRPETIAAKILMENSGTSVLVEIVAFLKA